MKATAALTLLLALGTVMQGATLFVESSGQFGSDIIAGPLAAPGGTWDFSFQVESSPTVFGVDGLGFDVPFSDFTYRLNHQPVNLAPDSIRFSTHAGGGLFTLFFGPESGFQNGVPVPEFLFHGPQVFLGTTAAPTIITGDFLSTSWSYSDADNYDNHPSGTVGVIIAPAPVPEPPAGALMVVAAGVFLAARLRLATTRP